MKVASSVENVWIPNVEAEGRRQLRDSLWLSSGATGMKVWLTLSSQVEAVFNIICVVFCVAVSASAMHDSRHVQ